MKSQHCIDTILAPAPRRRFGLPPWIAAAFRLLGSWSALRRQRQQLAMLDDRMLRDLGLSRMDVQIEIEKPFWRP